MTQHWEKTFTWCILVFLLAFFALTWAYSPRARLVPLVVIIPAIILAGGQLWYAHRGSLKDKPGSLNVPTPAEQGFRERKIFFWLLLLVALLYLFGFLLAIPIFLVLFLRGWAKQGWPQTLGLAAGISLAVYLSFELGFRITLYRGLIWSFMP